MNVDPGCGCGGTVDPARLAHFATHNMQHCNSTAEWTHCSTCARPYTNRNLLSVLLKQWGKLATTEADRIPVYTAMADVFDRGGNQRLAKEALRCLVKGYETTGRTLASSEDMLVAFLRYGGKLFTCGNHAKAEEVFDYIARHSGSRYAWTGVENLAELKTRKGHHNSAVALLEHALTFDTLDKTAKARIEMRLATACMRTFQFSRALAIARAADTPTWQSVANVNGPKEHLQNGATEEIARYASSIKFL